MAFDFTFQRMGTVMEPDPANPDESMGVLNPGIVRDRDGALRAFPRIVGPRNFSRVGCGLVTFDSSGNPTGVQRQGYALEPQPSYERHGETGGCEDPRVVYFPPLDTFLMTYAAWGPSGPRVALAVSRDLETWRRTGRVDFIPDPSPVYSTNFDVYHNKDGIIFPDAVPGPDGRPSLALLHRPVYETAPGTTHDVPPGVDDPMPSIWISYCPLDDLQDGFHGRLRLHHHHCLADPETGWEALRIGGGAPPILTKHGWLFVYHGVSGLLDPLDDSAHREAHPGTPETKRVCYRAGVMLLDTADPRRVLYRTQLPVLEPASHAEAHGTVENVVFPTGLDVRADIGCPNRVDVYYGMADSRIGAATFTLPE
ncbi:MAG TPA: glycosidase [Armatimonadota bacterium]